VDTGGVLGSVAWEFQYGTRELQRRHARGRRLRRAAMRWRALAASDAADTAGEAARRSVAVAHYMRRLSKRALGVGRCAHTS